MDHPFCETIIMCINISSHTQHKTHSANQALIHGYKNLTTKLWSVLCVMGNVGKQYVTFIAFPQQQWLHERASMLRYAFTACIKFINNA
jgi:undecaprenyl pyrophosphate synthase